jgi:hypothetical protein
MTRRGSFLIVLAILIIAAVAACTGDDAKETGSEAVDVTGPALVMFYTDN